MSRQQRISPLASVALAFVLGTSWAQSPPSRTTSGAPGPSAGSAEGSVTVIQAEPATAVSTAGVSGASGLMGQHSMSGKVVTKNSATGNVRLSTAEGSLTLHFPPQSLAQVKEGATITVHLGFAKGAGGAAQLPAPAGLQMQGQHSMEGTVSELDPATGKLTLTTPTGSLDLHFPPHALSDVKQGDTLTVQMAFTQGATIGGIQWNVPSGASQ